MFASGLPVHAPSTSTGTLTDDGIALLLDLMEHEPAPAGAAVPGPGLAARAQDWTQRAAAWGAGPHGAWRAW